MAKFIATIAMLALSWLVSSWLLMLGVGIVHLHWLPSLPTIPFTFSLLICSLLLVRGLFAATFAEVIKGINK
jgi:hypothetical protein